MFPVAVVVISHPIDLSLSQMWPKTSAAALSRSRRSFRSSLSIWSIRSPCSVRSAAAAVRAAVGLRLLVELLKLSTLVLFVMATSDTMVGAITRFWLARNSRGRATFNIRSWCCSTRDMQVSQMVFGSGSPGVIYIVANVRSKSDNLVGLYFHLDVQQNEHLDGQYNVIHTVTGK